MKIRNVWMVAAALLVAPTAACDWFDDPSPDEARVSLDGPAGQQVEVLLSKQFITGITTDGITQIELFDADTLVRALPFDTVVSIRQEQRFFARTVDADTVSTQVRMQVFIDGSSRYDEQRFVNVDQLLFVFTFNQPITSFIELL